MRARLVKAILCIAMLIQKTYTGSFCNHFIPNVVGRMFEGNAATMQQSLEHIQEYLPDDGYLWPGKENDKKIYK